MKTSKLKAKRVEAGLTQIQLAEVLKVTVTGYRNKELGKTEFTCSELAKLVEVLKLTLEEMKEIFLTIQEDEKK